MATVFPDILYTQFHETLSEIGLDVEGWYGDMVIDKDKQVAYVAGWEWNKNTNQEAYMLDLNSGEVTFLGLFMNDTPPELDGELDFARESTIVLSLSPDKTKLLLTTENDTINLNIWSCVEVYEIDTWEKIYGNYDEYLYYEESYSRQHNKWVDNETILLPYFNRDLAEKKGYIDFININTGELVKKFRPDLTIPQTYDTPQEWDFPAVEFNRNTGKFIAGDSFQRIVIVDYETLEIEFYTDWIDSYWGNWGYREITMSDNYFFGSNHAYSVMMGKKVDGNWQLEKTINYDTETSFYDGNGDGLVNRIVINEDETKVAIMTWYMQLDGYPGTDIWDIELNERLEKQQFGVDGDLGYNDFSYDITSDVFWFDNNTTVAYSAYGFVGIFGELPTRTTIQTIYFTDVPDIQIREVKANRVIVESPSASYTAETDNISQDNIIEKQVRLKEGDSNVCKQVAEALLNEWFRNKKSIIGEIQLNQGINFDKKVFLIIPENNENTSYRVQKITHNIDDYTTTLIAGDIIYSDNELLARILSDIL